MYDVTFFIVNEVDVFMFLFFDLQCKSINL